MKFVLVAVVTLMLSACGTVGGAVSGAGEDLSRAGQWIKNR
jgi:predicted small secreted protein